MKMWTGTAVLVLRRSFQILLLVHDQSLHLILILMVIKTLFPVFGVEIKLSGMKILLNLKVKNNLNENLRPADQYFLSYHLYDQKGNLISFNNRRFILPVIIKKKHFSRCVPLTNTPFLHEFEMNKDCYTECQTTASELSIEKFQPVFPGELMYART